MAYDFHYTPTGTGVISGKEVLEQTEDAINDLGNTAISGVQEALDKAEQALTNSANAVDDAQTALNTANNAEGVAIQAQTDVSNLSGTVTNIGNRVTTAEGNISNLQGRMTTAEGNITNLQGRMTTAESDIGNLQTAVSTAQATANSAQQTATTARQQSYVFRYSSTALVASSTNSNTLLDNTDNLKVGDKVIDSNGVLFSVTAIDTANSTFTVGSALVDLALDGNVVHTSGNETISGDKVFNNRLIKNIDVVLGTAPSTGKYSNIDIADNNKSGLAQIIGGVYNTGQSYARFFVQNKTADDGTGLSPTGTIRSCGFNINLPASSTSEGQGSITPRANKTTDFGLSGYQWRNIWCETLFLNGTQLDPSAFALDNAVVHLSGNETVGGQKTFTNSIILQNSDTSGLSRDLFCKSRIAVLGDAVSGDNTKYRFVDKNNNEISYIRQRKLTNSNTAMSFCVKNIDNDNNSISAEINFVIDKNNDPRISPSVTDSISLGRPTFRWKDVQTNLVNGLAPSSLGMPSDRSARVDISGYFTNMASGDTNTYTAPSNGWIYLALNDVTAVNLASQTSGGLTNYGDYRSRSSNGAILCLFPVRKDDVFVSQWYTTTTVTVTNAYFIPCQGNI